MKTTHRIMGFIGGSVLLAALSALAGCQQQTVTFPEKPLRTEPWVWGGGYKTIVYDTIGNGKGDYAQLLDPAGQVVSLEYLKQGPERIPASEKNIPGLIRNRVDVDLSTIDRAAVPHFFIILDGTPLRMVEKMRAEGHFRLFPPPSRVEAPFPSNTDLAINQIMHTGPSTGYEAKYFDREQNRVLGGTGDYVSASNSPWIERMDYRISLMRDGDAYLSPSKLFHDELAGMKAVFDKAAGPGTVFAYTVGTTGLATTGGEKAVREYLLEIDRLCEQIVYERRGQVSITITADHGHNLQAGKRVSFVKFLKDKGWNVSGSLDGEGDKDVVVTEYGLVTYAAFWTRKPQELVKDLVTHEAADLVIVRKPLEEVNGVGVIQVGAIKEAGLTKFPQSYVAIVRGPGGKEAYSYEWQNADPLRLGPILARLKADGQIGPNGEIDEDALFQATAEHEYPDALKRIWFAFHGLAKHPPDVIVSLKDPWYHGSALFDALITEQSTHGSLNRINSETFVLSTRAKLPPLIRQEQILGSLGITWADVAKTHAAPTTQPTEK